MSTFGKIGARDLLYGKGVPRGYTEHDALTMTEYNTNVYIDTGIEVPSMGDFLMECDYANNPIGGRYTIIGGANGTSLAGQGMSTRGYLGYGEWYYYTQTWNRRIKITSVSRPVSVRFGVLGNMEFIEINGKTYTNELDGNERGTGTSHTFTWGRGSNAHDNFSGTIIGKGRIYIAGNVVWDGIPCSKNSDGTVGYWDIVSRRFFPANAGFAVYDNIVGGGNQCIESSESAFYAYSSDSFWKEAA